MATKHNRYEDTVTIACINFQTSWGDKAANLAKMKEIVGRAAQQGCNIIVFPELALSGYECDRPCTVHEKTADTIPGPATDEMAKAAAEHNVYIIFGMPEQDKASLKVRYISSALIGPEGLVGAHRKVHLATPPRYTESQCFTGGDDLPVFETRFGPLGIQICRDFWFFPELTRIQVLKGARIIINTTASPSGPGKSFFLTQQTGARACENMVFTASANLVGRELKNSYYGHSTIAGPSSSWHTKIYAQGGEAEEIVSATLNLKLLEWWEEQSPWRRDLKHNLILRELADYERRIKARPS